MGYERPGSGDSGRGRLRDSNVLFGHVAWRDNVLMGSFHFDGLAVTLLRDGTSEVVSSREGPVRVDGYTVGVVPQMDRPL